MAIALDLEDALGIRRHAAPPTPRRRRPRIAVVLALLVLVAVLVWIAVNERQANSQFDRADHSLAPHARKTHRR